MNTVAVDHRSKQSRRDRPKGTGENLTREKRPERKSRAEVNHDVRSQNAFACTRPHRGQRDKDVAASSIRL